MDDRTIFAALRDALAVLYPEEQHTHVVVDDAGLDASQISFSQRSQTNWQNILNEARRQNQLETLLSVVLKAYGNNPQLKDAYTQYCLFIEQGGDTKLSARPFTANNSAYSIETDGGNGLTAEGFFAEQDKVVEGDKTTDGNIKGNTPIEIGQGTIPAGNKNLFLLISKLLAFRSLTIIIIVGIASVIIAMFFTERLMVTNTPAPSLTPTLDAVITAEEPMVSQTVPSTLSSNVSTGNVDGVVIVAEGNVVSNTININSKSPSSSDSPSCSDSMEGGFNIAIAKFNAMDQQGQPIQIDASENIPFFLYETAKELKFDSVDNFSPNVSYWPPKCTRRINATEGTERINEAKSLSQEINADIIFYGTITSTVDALEIELEFYVRYEGSFRNGDEIVGQHRLGRPFSIPNARDYWGDLVFRRRLIALTQIVEGLVYYQSQNFQSAINVFEKIQLERGEGMDVVHLLLANANLFLSPRKVADEYLEKALINYNKSLDESDGEYVRALIGKASALGKKALGNWEGEPIPNDINQALLDEAEQYLEQAKPQPEIENVEAKIHFTLGQLYLYRVLGDQNGIKKRLLDRAEMEYLQVLTYANEQISYLTAHAYADLGLIEKIRDKNNLDAALDYLNHAVSVAPEYDKARYLYQLGAYQVDIGMNSDAVKSFEECVVLSAKNKHNDEELLCLCSSRLSEFSSDLVATAATSICEDSTQKLSKPEVE